jgi:hypothetical protein
MSTTSAIADLKARLDVVFVQVQATRQIRDNLDNEWQILKKEPGFDALVKADIEYRTVLNTYWDGVEELRILIEARDAQAAEAARATKSEQNTQSN